MKKKQKIKDFGINNNETTMKCVEYRLRNIKKKNEK